MRLQRLYSLVLLVVSINASAQELKVDLSYNYIYSNQLDKIIQTYNFSRPFLTEKQPLLMNGINTSFSYIFKNERYLNYGINVAYSYFRSVAENENMTTTLQLNFLKLGYFLHYENPAKWKGLYTDIILSASSSGLFRNVNGEPFIYDEARSKAFGIGGELNLKLGYSLKIKNRTYVSPFISFAYTPYLYSPNSEVVINQTKGLCAKNWTSILGAQIGLAVHLRQQKND
jgi:hypothetical protein